MPRFFLVKPLSDVTLTYYTWSCRHPAIRCLCKLTLRGIIWFCPDTLITCVCTLSSLWTSLAYLFAISNFFFPSPIFVDGSLQCSCSLISMRKWPFLPNEEPKWTRCVCVRCWNIVSYQGTVCSVFHHPGPVINNWKISLISTFSPMGIIGGGLMTALAAGAATVPVTTAP